MTSSPESLSKRCLDMVQGVDSAVSWVKEVRAVSPQLDREADGLIDRLRRSRNMLRRLGASSGRPMSVGFFGISQAGKSYLISSLASDDKGELDTLMDGERLNFIRHVNPPGKGKEATGLVTRFTRTPPKTTPGYPVRLMLCSEADLVKILGNSFMNDFDQTKVSFDLDAARIRSRLFELEGRRQPRYTGGMSEDDVVDIKDYFEKRHSKLAEALKGDYWPTAIELAPYLQAADRAQLFAILWGDIPEMTGAYLRLREGLDRIGHPRMVDAPISALVNKSSAGEWVQTNSIMNVDILNRFGQDDHDRLGVMPILDGKPGVEVGLARSLLAALTVEMVFALEAPPQAKLLEQVDLLDFPGYRGRLCEESMDKIRQKLDGDDPMAALLLRGKVAYLFERYTDDQEMNVLVMCSASSEQNNINDLGPALDKWVRATQGGSAEERAKRRPGLAWAITKFDMRLALSPGESEDNLRSGWSGMLTAALLERFRGSEWLSNWSGNDPFNNIFLVRKPSMAASIIETADGKLGAEIGIAQSQVQRMAMMRRTFSEVEAVRKHVREPESAWDAMMALNDGGMGRLASYLEGVAIPEAKYSRIEEQVEGLCFDLSSSVLGSYFRADGADEVERKKQIVEKVLKALGQRPTSFGALLHALQPTAEHVRSLYLRADQLVVEPEPEEVMVLPVDDGLISLDDFGFGTEEVKPSPAPVLGTAAGSGRAARFSRAVISDWIGTLRELPDDHGLLRMLGLPADILQAVAEEVITGAMRYRLEEKMVAALQAAEEHAAATRNKLAGQQVLVADTLITDFVDYLGFSRLPLAERPKGDPRIPSPDGAERRVFSPVVSVKSGALPELTPKQLNYSGIYILDWFEAFRNTAIGNAGHAAGSEIPPEQNDRLGVILEQITGATLGHAPASSGAA
ncbi:putative virulence factor [Magnetospirillum molischianum]|uniref:Virulence factor n=1 Tax=Magnetospirillum molischianum DSM 120 TaxID=1150626 RepID=H8FWR0_MAGML|nr:putative virulence factor [Magnetospirillum molischianum]CCG42798.1 conserved hypothetical protein [Magnetospirillum molischianum DSM 120]